MKKKKKFIANKFLSFKYFINTVDLLGLDCLDILPKTIIAKARIISQLTHKLI